MARTKQTARKSVGTKAAHKKAAAPALPSEEESSEQQLAEEEQSARSAKSEAAPKAKAKKPAASKGKATSAPSSPRASPARPKKAAAKAKEAPLGTDQEEFDPARPCESGDRKEDGFYSLATLKSLAKIRGIAGHTRMDRDALCAELRKTAPAAKRPSEPRRPSPAKEKKAAATKKKAPSPAREKSPSPARGGKGKAAAPKKAAAAKKAAPKKPSAPREGKKGSARRTKKPIKHSTIVDALRKKGNFDVLLKLLDESGLTKLLAAPRKREAKGTGITLLAPTDQAFAALQKGDLKALRADPVQLKRVLSYHVVPHAELKTKALLARPSEVPTLEGGWLTFARDPQHPLIVDVGRKDVDGVAARTIREKREKRAKNGYIHPIDAVLFPPDLEESGAAPAPPLLTHIKKPSPAKKPAGGGKKKAKAPSPAREKSPSPAREKSPSPARESPKKGKAKKAAPAKAKKPSPAREPTAKAKKPSPAREPTAKAKGKAKAPAAATPTVAAVIHERFHTLEKLLDAADLTKALRGKGPFTVFAPTDEALAELPSELMDALLSDPELLGQLLAYHVVPELGAGQGAPGKKSVKLPTLLEGEKLRMAVKDGHVYVGAKSAKVMVVEPQEVIASNGVVHAINDFLVAKALQPEVDALLGVGEPVDAGAEPAEDTYAAIEAEPDLSQFLTLVDAAGMKELLQGSGIFTILAPTNAAFDALPAGTIEGVLDDEDKLNAVIDLHVQAGLSSLKPPAGARRLASATASDVYVVDKVMLPAKRSPSPKRPSPSKGKAKKAVAPPPAAKKPSPARPSPAKAKKPSPAKAQKASAPAPPKKQSPKRAPAGKGKAKKAPAATDDALDTFLVDMGLQ